jgi:Zn-dependent protease
VLGEPLDEPLSRLPLAVGTARAVDRRELLNVPAEPIYIDRSRLERWCQGLHDGPGSYRLTPNISYMPVRGAVTLFHLRGIRIGLDYSWFLVLLLVIISLSDFYRGILDADSDAFEPYLLAVISALLFFGSILLHELGHALVAIRNGIAITDITLWLFGGVARMARDSDTPATEFKVAIAGPLVTLAIAGACVGVGVAATGSDFWEVMAFEEGVELSGFLAVIGWLASINVIILLFNLLPAFPLDGGRVARALAWWRTGDRGKATRFAATLGQGFAYAFIGFGLFLLIQGAVVEGIWFGVLGWLLAQSARSAAAQTALSSRIEHLRIADVMDPDPVAIPSDLSVERALDEYFLRYRWPWFPVVDAAHQFLGLVRRGAADEVPETQREVSRVADLLDPGAVAMLGVPMDAPLESVLGNEELRKTGALAAVDAEGRLRGVVTVDQIGRALREAVSRS